MSTSRRTFLYIDGGYLRAVIHNLSNQLGVTPPVELDWEQRFGDDNWRKLFNPDRILYYDAPPPQKGSEVDADYKTRLHAFDAMMTRLNARDGFIARSGYVRGKGKRARQKGVDIELAVEMLNHSMFGRIDEAVLLSGDLDFKPVVDTLVRLGTKVTIFAERTTASEELLSAVDRVVDFRLIHALNFFSKAEEQKYSALNTHMNFAYPGTYHTENFKRQRLLSFSLLDRNEVNIFKETHQKDGSQKYYLTMKKDSEQDFFQKVWGNADLSHLLKYVAVDTKVVGLPEASQVPA